MREENEENMDNVGHTSNDYYNNNFYSAVAAYMILVRIELILLYYY